MYNLLSPFIVIWPYMFSELTSLYKEVYISAWRSFLHRNIIVLGSISILDILLLVSYFHYLCWDIWYNPHLSFCIYRISFFLCLLSNFSLFSSSLAFCNLKIAYLTFCLLFVCLFVRLYHLRHPNHLGSMGLWVSLILKTWGRVFWDFKYCAPSSSSFSGIQFACMLYLVILSSQFLDILFCFSISLLELSIQPIFGFTHVVFEYIYIDMNCKKWYFTSVTMYYTDNFFFFIFL